MNQFDLYKVNNLDVAYKSNNEEVTIAGAFFQKFSSYEESITIIGDINQLKAENGNSEDIRNMNALNERIKSTTKGMPQKRKGDFK